MHESLGLLEDGNQRTLPKVKARQRVGILVWLELHCLLNLCMSLASCLIEIKYDRYFGPEQRFLVATPLFATLESVDLTYINDHASISILS